jgi:hypothetical protein
MVSITQAQVQQTGRTKERYSARSHTHPKLFLLLSALAKIGSATDFPAHLNLLAPAVDPLLDDDLTVLAVIAVRPSNHGPMPFMSVHNLNTAVLTVAVLFLTPFRNWAAIVAVWVTMLVPTRTVFTVEAFTAVICNPLRPIGVIGADYNRDFRRLSGTP